jgi:hypothetical protein
MNCLKKFYLPTIYISISFLIFCYVLFRVFNVGLTYDEAWTLKSFVPLKTIEIINFTKCDANNHILNTLLIKLFIFIGNENLFYSRLSSLLSLIIYLIYSYKISRLLPIYSGILLFVLFIFNPFLIDFFGLARGYSIGIAFQTVSLYYFINFLKNNNIFSANYASIFAAIGVLGNFSQLNYFISIVAIIVLFSILNLKQSHFKILFYQFLITVLLGLIIYEPIRKLVKSGSLYYGGNSGFYNDTLMSLTKYIQYTPFENSLTQIILNCFLVFLFLGIIVLIAKRFKKKNLYINVELYLLVLLVTVILSTIVQHSLFGTLFLIDRTALIFYPLFFLVFVFSFNLMQNTFRNIIFTLFLFLFLINFQDSFNTYKTALWYFDSHTEKVLAEINAIGVEQNKKIKIDFSWPFQSVIYYNMDKNKFPFIKVSKSLTNREELDPNVDYYLYLNKSLEIVGYDSQNQKILDLKRDTVKYYSEEGVFLFNNLK